LVNTENLNDEQKAILVKALVDVYDKNIIYYVFNKLSEPLQKHINAISICARGPFGIGKESRKIPSHRCYDFDIFVNNIHSINYSIAFNIKELEGIYQDKLIESYLAATLPDCSGKSGNVYFYMKIPEICIFNEQETLGLISSHTEALAEFIISKIDYFKSKPNFELVKEIYEKSFNLEFTEKNINVIYHRMEDGNLYEISIYENPAIKYILLIRDDEKYFKANIMIDGTQDPQNLCEEYFDEKSDENKIYFMDKAIDFIKGHYNIIYEIK
jgi:hypothetical protein